MIQQHADHRRHHHRHRDRVLLDRVHHRGRIEQRDDHRRAALRGTRRRSRPSTPRGTSASGAGTPRRARSATPSHTWYRFSISARWSSSTPFGSAGRAAGVHQDHRVVFFGLVGDAPASPPRAAPRTRRRAARRRSPIITTCSSPTSSRTCSITLREERVGEADLRAGVGEDVRELLRREPQVERIDDAGAEERGVVAARGTGGCSAP